MDTSNIKKLTYTLQDSRGVILNKGQPQERPVVTKFPVILNINRLKSVRVSSVNRIPDKYIARVFAECIRQHRLPELEVSILGYRLPWIEFSDNRKSEVKSLARHLKSNLMACCLPEIDLHFMRRHMKALNRMDLEQAAAVVLSAIRNDLGIPNRRETIDSLVRELDPKIITWSCMWLEDNDREPRTNIEKVKKTLDRILMEQPKAIKSSDDSGKGYFKDWKSLLPLLLRIRRSGRSQRRCLFIPRWIFDVAGMRPPPQYTVWGKYGVPRPGHEPTSLIDYGKDNIILSRHHFRTLQRRLLRLYRFWDPKIRYRQLVHDFMADVFYGARFLISKAVSSHNTIVVAHYFFALQRRLQLKVGSPMYKIGSKETESRKHIQNNPDILTTFEQRLSDFSRQNGLPVNEDILTQIDQCCLLMRAYVEVYGGGRRANLVFTLGQSAKSSRGAVDQYNLLCKGLSTLCTAAKKEGLPYPEPVHKFLAIRTMVDKQAFGDDAFANGKMLGWQTWLAQRGNLGVITL